MNLVLYVFHAGPPAERSSGKPPERGHLQMDYQNHQERFSFIHSSFSFLSFLLLLLLFLFFLIFSVPAPFPPFQYFVVSVSYAFCFCF